MKIKVALVVNSPTPQLSNEIRSFASRELRSLGDVEVGDESVLESSGGYGLVVQIIAVGDQNVAYSATAVRRYGTEQITRWSLVSLLNRDLTDEQWDFVHRDFGEIDLLGQWVHATPRGQLRESFASLIAQLDSVALGNERKRKAHIRATAPKFNPDLGICANKKFIAKWR